MFKHFNDIPRAKQIERWEQAIRVLRGLTAHQRKQHFDMRVWGERDIDMRVWGERDKNTPCRTTACAAGWCALDPWFRRQGLKMDFKLRVRTIERYEIDDHYAGPAIKVPFVETIFNSDDVALFFGYDGTSKIFHNARRRPVAKVIAEMKAYVAELKQNG